MGFIGDPTEGSSKAILCGQPAVAAWSYKWEVEYEDPDDKTEAEKLEEVEARGETEVFYCTDHDMAHLRVAVHGWKSAT